MVASGTDEPAPRARRGDGQRPPGTRKRKKKAAPADDAKNDGGAVTDFLKSREGRATVNNVVRGAFGVLKGFMK
jgi:hypothetical protein